MYLCSAMSELKVEIEKGETFTIEDFKDHSALVNGTEQVWDSIEIKEKKFHIIKSKRSYVVEVVSADAETKTFELKVNNTVYKTKVEDRFDLLLQKLGMDNLGASAASELKAPMPGMVLKVEVAKGKEVKEGDPLVVLEAMKMENVLKSPTDAVIQSVEVTEGQAVEKNQILIQFES